MERTDFEQWKAKEVARLLALVETERRYYQEIVASLPVALVVLSADRSIVSANRAFRRTFGVRTEDLRRKLIDQILPSQQLIEQIRGAHVNGMPQPDAIVAIDQKQFRVAVVPMRNWDEESERETLLLIEDLSARAPVRSPAISSEFPAILWQADASTLAFISVGGAFERLLGYPSAHWLKTPHFFRERIHPEDRAAAADFLEAAIARGAGASAEFRAVSSSGTVVWCRETIRVSGQIATGVITDITERKQLEDQWLTAGRSSALHSFASRLAHDLNNPLMIITGYAEELLNNLPPGNPAREDVEQILGATARISGITERLIGFTRRIASTPQPVDLAALSTALEEKIAGAAGVPVTLEPSDRPVWALADPSQMEEVVLALVSTAQEDSRERSRVAISCYVCAIEEQIREATLQPGTYACLAIHDDGREMEAGRRASIFECVLSSKDALARAYATVREWGGDIAFSSQPSEGTTFTIYLPWCEPETAAPAPATVPAEAPAEKPRETILLVEDEAGIRALVCKILRREKYGVIEAASAEEALKAAAAHEGRIDLLLTDVTLPGMSGRELAEGLREWLPDVKVLYISGYTSDEAVRTGDFPPGSKFLQKPFTLSALVGKVRETLDTNLLT